ncbi:hypothetical protein [Sabulicella glaciei]|uniref:Uncharacterized protein n=1 Tax=Sabulicella glaciei TaxID=2984948 RepID=A0ABT3P1U2_9PROT|nr:hypothetical protein [Roseococcus sp. MDT2-1-1]MCW8088378.1 hypothetical protein [Roseococcus sp. MDT2-1-1]
MMRNAILALAFWPGLVLAQPTLSPPQGAPPAPSRYACPGQVECYVRCAAPVLGDYEVGLVATAEFLSPGAGGTPAGLRVAARGGAVFHLLGEGLQCRFFNLVPQPG